MTALVDKYKALRRPAREPRRSARITTDLKSDS